MGFFELPPPKPKRRRRRRKRKIEEDSWNPPSIYLPRYLSRDFVLASNEEVAVVVQGIACYPNGFSFELRTVTRFHPEEDDQSERYYGLVDAIDRGHDGEVRPEQLRFGISFSNGAKATTLDPLSWDDSSDQTIRLRPGGGSGGNGQQRHDFWVSPLPPPGPVDFVCEWPVFGIEETHRRIEGSNFIKAAGKSKPIF